MTSNLLPERLDVNRTEAVEYLESLGFKIALNGIGLGTIVGIADLLKAKILSVQSNDIIVVTSSRLDPQNLMEFRAIVKVPVVCIDDNTVISSEDILDFIPRMLKLSNASVEDRKRLAELILNAI